MWHSNRFGAQLAVLAMIASTMFGLVGCSTTHSAAEPIPEGYALADLPTDRAWVKLIEDQKPDVVTNLFAPEWEAQRQRINQQEWARIQNSFKSSNLPNQAFAELSHQMSQQVVGHLASDTSNKYRAVIAVAKFSWSSEIPEQRVRSMVEDVFRSLNQNQAVTDKFNLVNRTEKDAQELVRTVGGNPTEFRDLTGETSGGPASYDPKYVYVMGGSFYQDNDPTQHRVDFKFNVDFSNVSSRTLVPGASQSLTKVYFYHPYRGGGDGMWISEAQNLELRDKYNKAIVADRAAKAAAK